MPAIYITKGLLASFRMASRVGRVARSVSTWTGCIPGDPSTSTVTTTSYMVDEDVGQNPFSGVVLTGTAGVPGPFTVSGGQTVVINWTLTFQ